MGLLGRSRTAPAAGVIATLVLVLVFGNQAYTEWVARHARDGSVWSWFLRTLAWPSWAFGPSDSSAGATRNLLARDLRALLLIVLVAGFLAMCAKSLTGGAGTFFLGWASLIFASALAAFLTAFITTNVTWLTALDAAAQGSGYGLFVGWIVGIAVATAKGAGS